MTTKKPDLAVYLDEASLYFGGNDDNLKEDLRKIEGVPDATYLVTDNGVFVFAKLIAKVKEHRERMPDMPLDAMAKGLIPLATVSAEEAVNLWGVVPEPYELIPNNHGEGYVIRHCPFNAVVPGIFSTKEEANKVLALLLIGGIQPGDGDFVYRGQPMVLCKEIGVANLPSKPFIQEGLEPADYFYTHLSSVAFEDGFAPIPQDLFAQAKAIEASWQDNCARAARHARRHASDVWQWVKDLSLTTLNDPHAEVPEYGLEDLKELRSYYPELSMLSDGSFYELFDSYQVDCCYLNGWTAVRDDSFLFYLLGELASSKFEGEHAAETGRMVAFALLRGDSIEKALVFGQDWANYTEVIRDLAFRIGNAMRFLFEDKKTANHLHGRPIVTLLDAFRRGRKFSGSVSVTPVTQKLSDFVAPGAK